MTYRFLHAKDIQWLTENTDQAHYFIQRLETTGHLLLEEKCWQEAAHYLAKALESTLVLIDWSADNHPRLLELLGLISTKLSMACKMFDGLTHCERLVSKATNYLPMTHICVDGSIVSATAH